MASSYVDDDQLGLRGSKKFLGVVPRLWCIRRHFLPLRPCRLLRRRLALVDGTLDGLSVFVPTKIVTAPLMAQNW